MSALRKALRTCRIASLRVRARSLLRWSIQPLNCRIAPSFDSVRISAPGGGSASTPSIAAIAPMPVSIASCQDARLSMLVSKSKRRLGLRL